MRGASPDFGVSTQAIVAGARHRGVADGVCDQPAPGRLSRYQRAAFLALAACSGGDGFRRNDRNNALRSAAMEPVLRRRADPSLYGDDDPGDGGVSLLLPLTP